MQKLGTVTGHDTSAAAFEGLGNESRRRLKERLCETLRAAHQQGVRDMSRRELRDYHNEQTGEWLELTFGKNGIDASNKVYPFADQAARLIDRMHELGYIGGFEGSKPRKILITLNQLMEMQMKAQTDASDEDLI